MLMMNHLLKGGKLGTIGIINFFGSDYTAVRFNGYKLIVGTPYRNGYASGGYFDIGAADPYPQPKRSKSGKYYLFDLSKDPYEKVDLSSFPQHQETIKSGLFLIRSYIADGYRVEQKNVMEKASYPNLHNGTWFPYLETHPSSLMSLF